MEQLSLVRDAGEWACIARLRINRHALHEEWIDVPGSRRKSVSINNLSNRLDPEITAPGAMHALMTMLAKHLCLCHRDKLTVLHPW